MNSEDELIEFYKDHDIIIETDLLGDFYAHDPLCIFFSPSFTTVPSVNSWMSLNLASLRKKLTL